MELNSRELLLSRHALLELARNHEAIANKEESKKRPNIIDIDMNRLMAREVRALMEKLGGEP